MQQWEYLRVPFPTHEKRGGGMPSRDEHLDELAALGREGWELVSVTWWGQPYGMVGYFKRALG